MATGNVVYSLRFSLIKILPEPGFDLGSTAGESSVLTAKLHMLYEELRDDKRLRRRLERKWRSNKQDYDNKQTYREHFSPIFLKLMNIN